jgi:hypothetical protein
MRTLSVLIIRKMGRCPITVHKCKQFLYTSFLVNVEWVQRPSYILKNTVIGRLVGINISAECATSITTVCIYQNKWYHIYK